jgi:hypothetical protein
MYICFFTLNFAVNRVIWYAVPENVKGMACLVINDMLPCVAQGLGAFDALGLQRAGVAADSPLLTLSMIGGSFVWMAALHFKAKKGYQVHVVREFCNQVRARLDQDETLTGTLPALKMFVTAGTLPIPVRRQCHLHQFERGPQDPGRSDRAPRPAVPHRCRRVHLRIRTGVPYNHGTRPRLGARKASCAPTGLWPLVADEVLAGCADGVQTVSRAVDGRQLDCVLKT